MPEFEKSVDMRTFPFEMRQQNPLGILEWMENQIQDFKPDLLHVHKCDYPGVFGLFLNFSPLIFTLWDGIHVRDPRISHAAKKLINIAGAKSELFTCNSPRLLAECIEKGVPQKKALLTSWGVSPDVFNLDFDRRKVLIEKIKNKHGIKKGEKIVFSPRVITHFSNIDTLVQAIDDIADRSPDPVKFLFAAYVVTQDGLYTFGHLLHAIRNRDKVRWCGHITDEDELCAYYQLADVVVSLYSGYLESSPASIIEAMMCGAIPVAADLPVIRFWITDGENGYITHARDTGSVTNKVLSALEMAKTRPEVKVSNHLKALEQANYSRTMVMMEEYYRKIAKKKHPGFHPIGRYQQCYEKGLLLDVFNRHDEALDFYRMANQAEQTPELRKSIRSCVNRLKKKTGYVDPTAKRIFKEGKALAELRPSPSGDMREYVWAASLINKEDIPRLHSWLKKLAKKFQYNMNYLAAIYFEKDVHFSENLVHAYLAKYRPLHVGLIPMYLKMSRQLKLEGKNEEALDYCCIILETWKRFDDRFKSFLGETKHWVADANYQIGFMLSVRNGDSPLGRKYLRQAFTLNTEHWMARRLLQYFHSADRPVAGSFGGIE
jgi:glycosyltransferase involved in cell wall biosynthesis